MRFSVKRFLGLLILIPFLLAGYSVAAAEEGEAEGKEEAAAGETAAVGEEKTDKGFYQKYVKPTDYAISRAFMKFSPLESPLVTNFRLFGSQIDALTEAVPGLEIMGMIRNRTWVNTHGRSGYTSGGGDLHGGSYDSLTAAQKDAALANKGRRNSQFNMIEWLGELEMRYSINPNLSLSTTLRGRPPVLTVDSEIPLSLSFLWGGRSLGLLRGNGRCRESPPGGLRKPGLNRPPGVEERPQA